MLKTCIIFHRFLSSFLLRCGEMKVNSMERAHSIHFRNHLLVFTWCWLNILMKCTQKLKLRNLNSTNETQDIERNLERFPHNSRLSIELHSLEIHVVSSDFSLASTSLNKSHWLIRLWFSFLEFWLRNMKSWWWSSYSPITRYLLVKTYVAASSCLPDKRFLKVSLFLELRFGNIYDLKLKLNI